MIEEPNLNVEDHIRPVFLERIRRAVGAELGVPAIANVTPHVFINKVTETIELLVRQTVAGKQHKGTKIHHQWPATWWQAFKERWFPKRLLRRYPVRYDQINIEPVEYVICPHLPAEGKDKHIRFALMDVPDAKQEAIAVKALHHIFRMIRNSAYMAPFQDAMTNIVTDAIVYAERETEWIWPGAPPWEADQKEEDKS